MTKSNQKFFYAWVGCSATTGEPHPMTKRMSRRGAAYKFYDRTDRNEFVEEYNDPNGNNRAIACTKRELRNYSLGQDAAEWEKSIKDLDATVRGEHGWVSPV